MRKTYGRFLMLLLLAVHGQAFFGTNDACSTDKAIHAFERQLKRIEFEQMEEKIDTKSIVNSILRDLKDLKNVANLQASQLKEVLTLLRRNSRQTMFDWFATYYKANIFIAVNRTFVFNPTQVNQSVALEWCIKIGLQQPILKSEIELSAVAEKLKLLNSKNGWYWLSASDSNRHELGQFHWTDGSEVNKSLWGKGDPNEYSNGTVACVDLYVGNAKLYDEDCSKTDRRILCEASGDILFGTL